MTTSQPTTASPRLQENHTGDTVTPSDPYVNVVSPRHHDELEGLSRTQKWTRSWMVTRWRLSRTIYSVPLPMLTARFDVKQGDLILTLPLLLILLAASVVLTNEHDVKMSGMPPTFTMFLVFGLVVRNNSLLLTLTGIPFERALFYHKLFAYATIILTALHAFSYRLSNDDGEEEYKDSKVITGAIAFVAMIFMYLLSLNKIRRRFFEFFLRVHWVLFIVVIVAAVAHGAFFALFGILPWFIDMLYRLIFRARTYNRGSSKTDKVSAGIVAPEQVTVHALSGDITRIQFPRVRKDTGEALEYEAGQYAFICIPAISYLEWHPFTLSSSPNEAMKVRTAAIDTNNDSPFDILLDGPYGNVSVDIATPGVYSHYVLFSGGIGVTPMRSIVNWLYTEHREGYRPDIKNVHFVWSVRDRDLIQALVDGTELHHETNNCESYFPPRIQDVNEAGSTFFSDFYLTRGEKDVEAQLDHQLRNCLRYGSRPDVTKILRSMGEKAKQDDSTRVAVLVCGPKPLVNGVVATGMTLSKEMKIQFDVHTELFDF
ncbi:hypothetical protein PPTG_07628 [Phytophthora nicotianae INRA-310]|uniref:FAD-binding FR-type domain-containing protein n=1 Tax=Phytophthora nicotianae (strain INRA-310) TaxID=761204 RepID=W2QQ26_PHYN3|nr:hypothetical protein PPTG_07628 [Phytophthora nicotianae INRA-310]ETN14624.1 hypothetical protein PPTG_07628 [Phytophthora nicotianae INRA-310]